MNTNDYQNSIFKSVESDKDYLYHFTKKEYLEGIIKKKSFVLCYNLEEYPFLQKKKTEKSISIEDLTTDNSSQKKIKTKFAYPMVCFCDIPQDMRLIPHANRYHGYGIGLTKSWGIVKGISPVHYIAKNSDVAYLWEKIIREKEQICARLKSEKIKKTGIDFLIDSHFKDLILLSSFIKPYKSDKSDEENIFYDEREWRYFPLSNIEIPNTSNTNTNSNFPIYITEEELKKREERKTDYELEFDEKDIKFLFVKRKEEKKEFEELLEKYDYKDVKIMCLDELLKKPCAKKWFSIGTGTRNFLIKFKICKTLKKFSEKQKGNFKIYT